MQTLQFYHTILVSPWNITWFLIYDSTFWCLCNTVAMQKTSTKMFVLRTYYSNVSRIHLQTTHTCVHVRAHVHTQINHPLPFLSVFFFYSLSYPARQLLNCLQWKRPVKCLSEQRLLPPNLMRCVSSPELPV